MKTKLFFLIFLLSGIISNAQTTNIIFLDSNELKNLRNEIRNSNGKKLYVEFYNRAKKELDSRANPTTKINYEGLLDTNPKRLKTMESFADIDRVVDLIYASYGEDDPAFPEKAKQIVVAWAKTYQPTGNPINENKLNAFFWAYYLFKNKFDKNERNIVEKWMLEIATLEKNRLHTPNNNWEAKRCKIIGIAGCILNNEELKRYSIAGFKKYIATAYYPDGTSNDLKQRDALSYHISGLKPCVSAFINLSKFDKRFDLFSYTTESGSSVKKSVEYVIPFATGAQQHREWVHTQVQLDKKRAEAGLPKYKPGKLFNPKKAWPLFELACFYNPEWTQIFTANKIQSWIAFLNQPYIRKTN